MKFFYVLLAVVLLYLGALGLLMNISSVSNLRTLEINGQVHVVPVNVLHAKKFKEQMKLELTRIRNSLTHSEILETKRRLAHAGIKSYADYHYSMMGNLTQQMLMVASLAVKAGKSLGSDFKNHPKVQAFLNQTQARLTTQVFSPLTQMNEQEQEQLYQQLSESRTSLMNLIHHQVQQQSLLTIPSRVLPKYKHEFTINKQVFKFSASATVGAALMFKSIRKRLIKSIEVTSMKLMGKIVSKFMAKQGVKTGSRLAAAGTGAVSAGAACSWGGPLMLLCGTGGAIVGFFATEFVFNKLDELITRDDFEHDLNQQVDGVFHELITELSSDIDQFEKIMLSHNTPQQEKVYLKDYL